MYNLGNFMQYYRPQFMQGEQFQQGMGQPGYSQQTAGGYQPAQQMYQGTPAQIPQPGGYQGAPQQWNPGGPQGNAAQRPMFQPRMNLGMFNGRSAAY